MASLRSRWDVKAKDEGNKSNDEQHSKRKHVVNESNDEAKRPKISFSSIGSSKSKTQPASTFQKTQIKINLGGNKQSSESKTPVIPKASIFDDDDEDDKPEEMPPEAKMRMRNIGRDTPTSAGPNSFGKTKHGFCDAKKVFERQLEKAAKE